MRSASAILAREPNGRPALRQGLGMGAWAFVAGGCAKKIAWCAFKDRAKGRATRQMCASQGIIVSKYSCVVGAASTVL